MECTVEIDGNGKKTIEVLFTEESNHLMYVTCDNFSCMGPGKYLLVDLSADEFAQLPIPGSTKTEIPNLKGLVKNPNVLEIHSNNPPVIVKTFENMELPPELLKGVAAMGFDAPSKIQETALPTLLAEPPRNMIVQSQSRTGKTAALVLAMLSRADPTKNYPHVVCFCPTSQLAIQTGEVAKEMAKFWPDIKIKIVVKGEMLTTGHKLTEHILIGTPGKLLDWGTDYEFFNPFKVKVFVIDNADVKGMEEYIERFYGFLPNTCQMMWFSAIYDESVTNFPGTIPQQHPDPVVLRLPPVQQSLDIIKQHYIVCDTLEEKYRCVSLIYHWFNGNTIIFCQFRQTAKKLAETMAKDYGIRGMLLFTPDMKMKECTEIVNQFRSGEEKVLITTNALARGIEFELVTMVVNFELPVDKTGKEADCETYLHRISRTEISGRTVVAINLVDGPRSEVPNIQVLREIEEHFGGQPMVELKADIEDIEKLNDY